MTAFSRSSAAWRSVTAGSISRGSVPIRLDDRFFDRCNWFLALIATCPFMAFAFCAFALHKRFARLRFCKYLVNCHFVYFVFPSKHHRVGIDFLKVQMDALNQLFFCGYADTPQHASRHLTEQGLHQVEP